MPISHHEEVHVIEVLTIVFVFACIAAEQSSTFARNQVTIVDLRACVAAENELTFKFDTGILHGLLITAITSPAFNSRVAIMCLLFFLSTRISSALMKKGIFGFASYDSLNSFRGPARFDPSHFSSNPYIAYDDFEICGFCHGENTAEPARCCAGNA